MGIAGSLLGGSISSMPASTMAKGIDAAQQQAMGQFDALNPQIEQGQQASGLIAQMLGLQPGTQGAEALNQFRQSMGYQDTLNSALGGVTSNAAARGLLG